jgi:hypothetical protein
VDFVLVKQRKTTIARIAVSAISSLRLLLYEEVCKATGCHFQTIKTAKKELGVLARKIGNEWYSVLPSKSTINIKSIKNTESEEAL